MPSGQGLLETTIAIGIIVTGLFAAFTLAISNNRAADAASDRFTAIQFAREGIEVVRARRDSNWLAGKPWNDGFDGDGTVIAVFDPTDASWVLRDGPNDLKNDATRIVRTQVGAATFLVQDPAGSIGTGATPYRRLLTFQSTCASGAEVAWGSCDADRDPAAGVHVASHVSWISRGDTHDVTLEETLEDWR